MAKNIVIFSDGTGQEGGKGYDTNVYKLFNLVEDRTDKQIVFYDRGLGTDWRIVSGNISGAGISKNILECYEFIFDNYEAGDQIYLFGFSRGAATVRSLSSFIHHFGILPKSREELIKQAYKIYKIKDNVKRDKKVNQFIRKHHTMWVRIKFLGVWDTVAALGLPFKGIDILIDKVPFLKHTFQEFKLHESVENAYHALAIDDRRKTFHPTLFDPNHLGKYQHLRQVWFMGMHTDVGGGYEEHGLSDISLEWMVKNAHAHGLRLYLRKLDQRNFKVQPDPNDALHNSRAGAAKLFSEAQRSWDEEKFGKIVIHESVLQRKLNENNEKTPSYKPWVLDHKYEVEPWEPMKPSIRAKAKAKTAKKKPKKKAAKKTKKK